MLPIGLLYCAVTRIVKVTSHGLSISRATPEQRKSSSSMIPQIKAIDDKDTKKIDDRLIHAYIYRWTDRRERELMLFEAHIGVET